MKTNTKDRIIAHLRKHREARVHDIVRFLGISRVAVHKHLKKLVAEGVVQKTGMPPHVSYAVARAPSVKRGELDQIKKMLKAQKPRLEREYGISRVGVFGSFAFGDFKNDSDIDIVAEFHRPIGLFRFMALENHLSQALGRKVDLVAKDGLKSYLRNDILSSTVYV